MTVISEPNVTVNIVGANVAASNVAQAFLLPAQMTAAGTATAGELYTNVSVDDIETLAGLGSIALDGYEAFRTVNKVTPIDMIFLDDPTGDAAVGTALFAGTTASKAGQYTVRIGSERNGKATVTVAKSDTPAQVATAFAAAYASLTKCLATVAVNGGTPEQIDITANNDGTEGNFVGLEIVGTVPGITYTLTGMTGGTGIPTLTTVFDVIGEKRYQTISWPGTYGTSGLTDLLEPRWNVNNAVKDGVGFVCIADTASNHVTALELLNAKTLCYQFDKMESTSGYKGPAIRETLFGRNCMFCGLHALRLSQDANIAQFVNGAGGPSDTIGGPAIASLPYFNSPLPIPVMEESFGFTATEKETIKTAGGYTIGNNTAGNQTIVGEVKTTYKTDIAGNPDPSFEFLNYVDTMSQVREYFFNNLKKDCAQSRLTEGDLLPNRNMNNALSIETKLIRYYGVLSGQAYVLLQAGEAARNFFVENLSITLNTVAGTVLFSCKTPPIVQLRNIIGTIQIAFSVNG